MIGTRKIDRVIIFRMSSDIHCLLIQTSKLRFELFSYPWKNWLIISLGALLDNSWVPRLNNTKRTNKQSGKANWTATKCIPISFEFVRRVKGAWPFPLKQAHRNVPWATGITVFPVIKTGNTRNARSTSDDGTTGHTSVQLPGCKDLLMITEILSTPTGAHENRYPDVFGCRRLTEMINEQRTLDLKTLARRFELENSWRCPEPESISLQA